MATVVASVADQLTGGLDDLSVQDSEQVSSPKMSVGTSFGSHGEICAICLDKIELEETALIKGCEHAYCVTCILQWATYKEKPTCPQCKHPLEFLSIHRSLDGSLHDYMLEENVCLLLRAVWFKPLVVEDYAQPQDDLEDYNLYAYGHGAYEYEYDYEYDDEDDMDEAYFNSSSSIRIGNRRWGDNGYVRAGRQEARPVLRGQNAEAGGASGSTRQPRQKEPMKEKTGRRAKRALKREAADKAAAAKHQMHLARFGRKE